MPSTIKRSKLALALLAAGVTLSSTITFRALEGTPGLYRTPEPNQHTTVGTPKNLARWHIGATLVLVEDDRFQRIGVSEVGYFEESVFLSDNSALTYEIQQGTHTYIIDLGQFVQVSRFFINT
jgi:hypothetical protein